MEATYEGFGLSVISLDEDGKQNYRNLWGPHVNHLWLSKTVLGSHFGVGAPPNLEPIGIGMLTGDTNNLDFPWAFVGKGIPLSSLRVEVKLLAAGVAQFHHEPIELKPPARVGCLGIWDP